MKRFIIIILIMLIGIDGYCQFFRSHTYVGGDCTTLTNYVGSDYQRLGISINNTGGGKVVKAGLILAPYWSEYELTMSSASMTNSFVFNTGMTQTAYSNYTIPFGDGRRYRAFSITVSDTVYGETLTVFGKSGTLKPPTLELNSISDIASISATANYGVTSDGGSSITHRGVCWNTTGGATTNDFKTDDGTGSGYYQSYITGLSSGTVYYVRSYAINTTGTGYSDQLQFTTLSPGVVPELTTNVISGISNNEAISGGVITYDGNATIIEKGLCYKIGSMPISTDNTINNGSGSASFISNMTGLLPNTEYHVRAWARNQYIVNGFTVRSLGYGQEEIFTTLPPSNILATLSSSLLNESATEVTVQWSLSLSQPSLDYVIIPTVITNYNNTGTTTQGFVLSEGQQTATSNVVYSKSSSAYTAYCNFGTMPSGFTGTNSASYLIPALGGSLPTLSTNSITNITSSSATSGGTISSDGGSSISSKGVQWSLDSGFSSIAGSTNDGSGIGAFSSSIIGLSCGSTYYVRAYATNSIGTGYGNVRSFTTISNATATITGFSSVTSTSFTANCDVTSSCSNITSRGIIYALSPGVTFPSNSQICGSGTGTYNCTPYTTLSPSTTYYVKSYAIVNGSAIYLSLESTVTTLAIPPFDPCTLSVGDSYGGGIVAYIFQSGDPGYVSGECHGIIAATSDQSSGIQWYNGSYVNVSGLSSELNSGSSNTDMILYVQGYNYVDYAAGLARSYTGGGFSDWCLPSLNDLIKLYNNKSVIGGFSSSRYWASGQRFASAIATMVDFSNGDYSNDWNKAYLYHVRAIRYF